MVSDPNAWFSGWGYFIWFGFILLLFSSMGNWGYTYRAHQRYLDLSPGQSARDILDERFAKGELKREEYISMREDLSGTPASRNQTKEAGRSKENFTITPPIIAT